jgi:5,10-methylene-tetrahydrofolate dehydrogenase/methenyl tetrahydrofolate cyclohydrolase
MIILDGKATAETIKKELAEEVTQIKAFGHKIPHLAAILVLKLMFPIKSELVKKSDSTLPYFVFPQALPKESCLRK